MHKTHSWLPKWELVGLSTPDPLCVYGAEYEDFLRIGKAVFGLGVMPEVNSGTGGNIAIRDKFSVVDGFLVTGSETHKGRLTRADVVLVTLVDWEGRILYFFREDGSRRQPSTDTLLAAKAFGSRPDLCVWIHFHCPISTEHQIRIPYPATKESDWEEFSGLVRVGAKVINLIDHDFRKQKPDGRPDSAIVLGETPGEALDLAIRLISRG